MYSESTIVLYRAESFRMLIGLGKRLPFSQREIMLQLRTPKTVATCFWVKPFIFLYFFRQFGIRL